MNHNPYSRLCMCVLWSRSVFSFSVIYRQCVFAAAVAAVVIMVIDASCILKNEIYAEPKRINQMNSGIHSRPPYFTYTLQKKTIINALLNDSGPFSSFSSSDSIYLLTWCDHFSLNKDWRRETVMTTMMKEFLSFTRTLETIHKEPDAEFFTGTNNFMCHTRSWRRLLSIRFTRLSRIT